MQSQLMNIIHSLLRKVFLEVIDYFLYVIENIDNHVAGPERRLHLSTELVL